MSHVHSSADRRLDLAMDDYGSHFVRWRPRSIVDDYGNVVDIDPHESGESELRASAHEPGLSEA